MKHTVFTLLLLISSVNFAQDKCDKTMVENLFQEKLSESRKNEMQHQKRYEKAVSKLAVINDWDKKAELAYLSKILTSVSYQQSLKAKHTILKEVVSLLSKIDKQATVNNCKVSTSIQDMLHNVIQKNSTEWNKLIETVNKDYQLVADKKGEASLEVSKRKTAKENINISRSKTIIGIWLDVEKEENFIFNADGTVYNQKFGTDHLYNMRYWYVEEEKICFTFSDETEGGVCAPYTLDKDVLSITVFGDVMKYQKK